METGIAAKYNRAVVEAPAKINVFLEITGRLENGYHLLETVMQAVGLSDLALISLRSEPGIRVTCTRPGIPEDEGNLAYRAASVFLAALRPGGEGGLHIHLDKRIPHEAGLGGGSADAAAVLAGLNALHGHPATQGELEELGLALGADVPFALRGGCALARGVGEELTPLPCLPPCHIVIAKPGAGMSTAEAYRLHDARQGHELQDCGPMCKAMEQGSLAACGAAMYNAFAAVCPGAEDIRRMLLGQGAEGAVLSGSGSAVAGLFADCAAAESAISAAAPLVREAFLTRPVEHGPRILFLD